MEYNNKMDRTLQIDDAAAEEHTNHPDHLPVTGHDGAMENATDLQNTAPIDHFPSRFQHNVSVHQATAFDHASSFGHGTPSGHATFSNHSSPLTHATTHDDVTYMNYTPVMDHSSPLVYPNTMEHVTYLEDSSPMTFSSPSARHFPMVHQYPLDYPHSMRNTSPVELDIPVRRAPATENIPAISNAPMTSYVPPTSYAPTLAQGSLMDVGVPRIHDHPIGYSRGIPSTPPNGYTTYTSRAVPTEYTTAGYAHDTNYTSPMGFSSSPIQSYPVSYSRGIETTPTNDYATNMTSAGPRRYTTTGYTHATNYISPMAFSSPMAYSSPMGFSSPVAYSSPMAYTAREDPIASRGHAVDIDRTIPMSFSAPEMPIMRASSPAEHHATGLDDEDDMAVARQPRVISVGNPTNTPIQTNLAGGNYDVDEMSFARPMSFADPKREPDTGDGAGLGIGGGLLDGPDLTRDAGVAGVGDPTNDAAEAPTPDRPIRRARHRPADDDPSIRACLECGCRRGAYSFSSVRMLSALADLPQYLFPAREWPGEVPEGGFLRCHPCRVKQALDIWGEYARAVKDRIQAAIRREVKSVVVRNDAKAQRAKIKRYHAAGLSQDDVGLGEGGRDDREDYYIAKTQMTDQEREKRLTRGRCIFLGPICMGEVEPNSPYCTRHWELYLRSENLDEVHQEAREYWNRTQLADADNDHEAVTGLLLSPAPRLKPRQPPEDFVADAIRAYKHCRTKDEEKNTIVHARRARTQIGKAATREEIEAARATLEEALVAPKMGTCSYKGWRCPIAPLPGIQMCKVHNDERNARARERAKYRRERKENERQRREVKEEADPAAEEQEEEGG
ncbi:hypothetical protein V8F20_011937 [Naviculisporaceae sp. PSN 640]